MWWMPLCSGLYTTMLPLLADCSERESVNRDVFFITGPFSFVKTHPQLSQLGCKLFSAVLPKSPVCERNSITPLALCSISECVLAVIRTTATQTESLLTQSRDKKFLDRRFLYLFLLYHLYFSPLLIQVFLCSSRFWYLLISFLQLLITSAKSALQKKRKKKINMTQKPSVCCLDTHRQLINNFPLSSSRCSYTQQIHACEEPSFNVLEQRRNDLLLFKWIHRNVKSPMFCWKTHKKWVLGLHLSSTGGCSVRVCAHAFLFLSQESGLKIDVHGSCIIYGDHKMLSRGRMNGSNVIALLHLFICSISECTRTHTHTPSVTYHLIFNALYWTLILPISKN